MTEPTAPSRPAARPGTTRWDDYLEIFIKPADVFRRREGTNPFPPLLVLTVAALVLYYATSAAMQPVMDAEYARGMEQVARQNPNMTPEQMQQGRAMVQTFGGIMAGIMTFLIPLLVGVVLWLVAKGAGSVATLTSAIVVAVFSYFPRILEGIVGAVLALLTPENAIRSRYDVTLGIGRFLDPATTSPLALAFLGRIDLFTIWVTVLVAIGIKIVGRLSTGEAAVVAAVVWLVGALPALAGAIRSAG